MPIAINRTVHPCQVVDKDGAAVLSEIEAAMYHVAASILDGEGFSFDVPSRAKGNQVGRKGWVNVTRAGMLAGGASTCPPGQRAIKRAEWRGRLGETVVLGYGLRAAALLLAHTNTGLQQGGYSVPRSSLHIAHRPNTCSAYPSSRVVCSVL